MCVCGKGGWDKEVQAGGWVGGRRRRDRRVISTPKTDVAFLSGSLN